MRDYRFAPQEKARSSRLLFEEKKLPSLDVEVDYGSYADGCKLYFRDGGWLICRFSGTEPLLRVFCEMDTAARAKGILTAVEDFLGLAPAGM